MNLSLLRFALTAKTTLGALYVDGVWECFILEDAYRGDAPKVPGETCIPNGRYEVRVTHSPKFGVDMPLLLDVPGFEGVRIHPGNGPRDTEGCLLPGSVAGQDQLFGSRTAYEALFAKLKAASGPAWLTITTRTP